MQPDPRRIPSLVSLVVLALAGGCSKSQDERRAPPNDSVAVGIPVEAGVVHQAVNPAKAPPYAGPSATVFGAVTITGDPAPVLNDIVATIPEECRSAVQVYGRLFREGQGRVVADALVAVTGYRGFVPARGPAVTLSADRCSFETRTIALTFGQRIDVKNQDDRANRTYIPKLLGARQDAMLVAIPKGDPVGVYPLNPGQYALVDSGFPFMRADVFALKYSTHDVTDLKGHYTIGGIPPGEVTVSAYLPAIEATAERRVTLAPNSSKRIDLTLRFDAAAYAAQTPKSPPTTDPSKEDSASTAGASAGKP